VCRALCTAAFNEPEAELVQRLPKALLKKLLDDIPTFRRGAALGLGALPRVLLLATPLSSVLSALVTATVPERVVSRRDAETRRNAVDALVSVCETVGLAAHGAEGLDEAQCVAVFRALVRASEDYATDNRGDVGSWVRRQAVDSLLRFVEMVLACPGRVLLQRAGGIAAASAAAGAAGAAPPPFVLNPAARRGQFLVGDGRAAAFHIMKTATPRSPYVSSQIWITPAMSTALVRAALGVCWPSLLVCLLALTPCVLVGPHSLCACWPSLLVCLCGEDTHAHGLTASVSCAGGCASAAHRREAGCHPSGCWHCVVCGAAQRGQSLPSARHLSAVDVASHLPAPDSHCSYVELWTRCRHHHCR
jgi:hypothetical protein